MFNVYCIDFNQCRRFTQKQSIFALAWKDLFYADGEGNLVLATGNLPSKWYHYLWSKLWELYRWHRMIVSLVSGLNATWATFYTLSTKNLGETAHKGLHIEDDRVTSCRALLWIKKSYVLNRPISSVLPVTALWLYIRAAKFSGPPLLKLFSVRDGPGEKRDSLTPQVSFVDNNSVFIKTVALRDRHQDSEYRSESVKRHDEKRERRAINFNERTKLNQEFNEYFWTDTYSLAAALSASSRPENGHLSTVSSAATAAGDDGKLLLSGKNN